MKHVLRKYFGVISLAAIAALLVACGGAPGGSGEPQVQTYTVSGIVTADGKPVRAVSISGEHAGGTAEAMSDNDGSWALTGLKGEVTITAEDPAYTTDGSITLSGAASGLSFVLNLKQCNSGRVDDQDDPCIITRIQQVQNIDQHLDGFFKLGADIDASETEDWNGGKGFDPIGRNINLMPKPFTGTFDGAGHTIDGLVINRPDENDIGLFGFIDEDETIGTVKNLVIKNPQVSGRENVGALAGDTSGGAVQQVSVVGGKVTGKENVGGLMGDSYSYLVIHVSSTATVTGKLKVGGLIGNWDGNDLTESFSDGIVTGNERVGGFVGEAEAEIHNSYSVSTVIGVGNDASDIGGFIGYMDKNIINSFSAGEISSEGAPAGVHGFASQNSGAAVDSYWDSDVAGVPTSGEGLPRSTEEMQKQASYVGWDFLTVWKINEGEDYPDLINNPRQ